MACSVFPALVRPLVRLLILDFFFNCVADEGTWQRQRLGVARENEWIEAREARLSVWTLE